MRKVSCCDETGENKKKKYVKSWIENNVYYITDAQCCKLVLREEYEDFMNHVAIRK